MSKLRALLINSETKTVTEVELEETLEVLQQHVGGYIEMGESLPNGDCIIVADTQNSKHFFHIKGTYNPYCGNAVILGKVDGEMTSAKSTVREIQQNIAFKSAQ